MHMRVHVPCASQSTSLFILIIYLNNIFHNTISKERARNPNNIINNVVRSAL